MKNTVLAFLMATMVQHAEKTAIIDGEKHITFQRLALYAKRLGCQIKRRSRLFRQPVAVLLPKSAESIIAFLGILYSGNCYVPLDESLPVARLKTILDNLEPKFIIASQTVQPLLSDLGCAPEKLISITEAYDESVHINEADISATLAAVIDTDPVYIIYTSGSTGVPKGVVVAHRGVIDYIDWAVECFGIDSTVIIGNQSPFYFDNSTLDIYLMLATGATLVIIPKQLFAYPMRLMEYLDHTEVNFIFWVPSVMIQVANLHILENIAHSHLTRILFAGEVMPNKHLNYWRKFIPQARYANLYGPTEITVDCTYYIVEREFGDFEPLPIGYPCRNSDILVLNNENRPVESMEAGELCVRGSSLALGYWNDQTKTAAAFVQNPLQEKYPERIYRTGDLVAYNSFKEIVFLGRKDNQIKHMGYRIELGEIETNVLGLAEIHNACAIYDKQRSEIILFYQADEKIGSNCIRRQLSKLLPQYMIPTKMLQVKTLPFNANGKIDRTALLRAVGLS